MSGQFIQATAVAAVAAPPSKLATVVGSSLAADESGEDLCGDEARQELIVPSCDLTAQPKRILARRSSKQIVRHLFDGGEVGRGMVGSFSALIVAKCPVHDPVQAVPDRPMGADDRPDEMRQQDQ